MAFGRPIIIIASIEQGKRNTEVWNRAQVNHITIDAIRTSALYTVHYVYTLSIINVNSVT